MEPGSPERGALKHVPLLAACLTSRKKENKNYSDKGEPFHIGGSAPACKKKEDRALLAPATRH